MRVLLRKATSAGYGMAQNSNSIDGVFVWVGGDCHHETHGGLMLLLGSLQCWILLLPHAAVGIDSCAAAPTSVGLFSPARCSRQIGAQEVRPHLKIPEARDDSPRRLRSLASSPTAERRARRRRPLSLLLGRGGDWPAAGGHMQIQCVVCSDEWIWTKSNCYFDICHGEAKIYVNVVVVCWDEWKWIRTRCFWRASTMINIVLVF